MLRDGLNSAPSVYRGRQSLSHQATTTSGTEINKESSEKQTALIKVVDVSEKKWWPDQTSSQDMTWFPSPTAQGGWHVWYKLGRHKIKIVSPTIFVSPQYCNIVTTGVNRWTVWQASPPLCLLSSPWERRRRSAVHTTWQRMASWGRSAAVDCLSCSGTKRSETLSLSQYQCK